MRINAEVNFAIPGVYNLRTLKSEHDVSGCNLTSLNPASKAVRVCLLLAVAVLLVNCADNSPTTVAEDFNYNGSYVAARVVERLDDDTQYVYSGSDLSGLLLIQDSIYTLGVFIRIGSSSIGRIDRGILKISNGYVHFDTASDTSLQSVPWGEYILGKEELKINYLKDNNLWTETWKRGQPVADSDTNFNYVPY